MVGFGYGSEMGSAGYMKAHCYLLDGWASGIGVMVAETGRGIREALFRSRVHATGNLLLKVIYIISESVEC